VAKLPILLYGHEILRMKARPVTAVTDDLVRLIMDMHETMRHAQGIGLAANQVGSLDRVFVVDLSEVEDMKDLPPMTFINPEIVSSSGELVMEEGCLSIPDVRDEVLRPESLVLRFRDTSFNLKEIEAGSLPARVIQHELDHLNGVLFLDHLSKERRMMHEEQLIAIQKGNIDVPYRTVTASRIPA
jgi:peptide deformylase